MADLTRGERNNNPMNLDYHSENAWQGQLGYEDPPLNGNQPRFAKFDEVQNGIRAGCKILINYENKYGLRTIRGMISRWAPGNENNTAAYISAVAKRTGFGPDDNLDLSNFDTLKALAQAIIIQENGRDVYQDAVVDDGVNRALGVNAA